jgi:hypothetical protein
MNIPAPYAADWAAWEQAGIDASNHYERAEEIFIDCVNGGWNSYPYIKGWMVEDVFSELELDALKLMQNLYWLGSQDEVKATNAKMWLLNLSKSLEESLSKRVDQQIQREAEDAQEAWELRHVD